MPHNAYQLSSWSFLTGSKLLRAGSLLTLSAMSFAFLPNAQAAGTAVKLNITPSPQTVAAGEWPVSITFQTQVGGIANFSDLSINQAGTGDVLVVSTNGLTSVVSESFIISGQPLALPKPLYGVTTDAIDHLSDIVVSLRDLPHKPTTRIVFDEFVPATDYLTAVKQIHQVSYVMGQILDSFYVRQYSVADYTKRAQEYLDALGQYVDIWEIGNEVNGEWLGNPVDVAKKIIGAYDIVKKRSGRTALTLYYNEDCWMYSWEEMFTWATENIPTYLKKRLDYVLVSYYEDDCNGLQPNWLAVFKRLGDMFPNSRIGFGEVGTNYAKRKEEYIKRYYSMSINHPNYIGGYFWWYFKQDMVPKTKYLWSVLYDAIR